MEAGCANLVPLGRLRWIARQTAYLQYVTITYRWGRGELIIAVPAWKGMGEWGDAGKPTWCRCGDDIYGILSCPAVYNLREGGSVAYHTRIRCE